MKVILLERISTLGAIGAIVEVKNGYGRNYLLPRGKAVIATDRNIADLQDRMSAIQAKADEKHDQATKLASAINGGRILIIRQADEDGRLYGSVTALEIVRSVKEQLGHEISKSSVVTKDPIKTLGLHQVTLQIFSDVTAELQILIARSYEEAKGLN